MTVASAGLEQNNNPVHKTERQNSNFFIGEELRPSPEALFFVARRLYFNIFWLCSARDN